MQKKTRNISDKPIFLKILKAVGLGFVHIPDIRSNTFQIIGQKKFNAVRLTLRFNLAKPVSYYGLKN